MLALLRSLAFRVPPSPADRAARLRAGQSAVVDSLPEECGDARRLREMGLVPGEVVVMLSSGRSCAVAVGETRLVVRREVLEGVRVLPLG